MRVSHIPVCNDIVRACIGDGPGDHIVSISLLTNVNAASMVGPRQGNGRAVCCSGWDGKHIRPVLSELQNQILKGVVPNVLSQPDRCMKAKDTRVGGNPSVPLAKAAADVVLGGGPSDLRVLVMQHQLLLTAFVKEEGRHSHGLGPAELGDRDEAGRP